jgi:glycosyltransferase involved in cell wall biosynthesis
VVFWFFFWLVIGFSIYFSLNLLTYTRYNRVLKHAADRKEKPVRGISVLIPARNEENNIVDCVLAALKNHYPSFEVIVMDDGSTDATYKRVSAIEDARLKVYHAPEKPSGWAGKNWACHQLYLKAKYDIYLFIDADARLSSDALWRINRIFTLTGADIVSGCPKQIPSSFTDRFLLPIIPLLPLGCLPLFKIGNFRFVRTAIHGSFSAYRRDFYERFGGYERIKDKWVDDAALNALVPKYHGKTEMLDVTGIVSCKMYTTGKQTVEGIARSLYHELYASIPLIIFLIAMLFLATIVPLILVVSSRTLEQTVLSLSIFAIITSIFATVDVKYGFPWYSAFLHPLMFFGLTSAAFLSIKGSRKKNMVWKGRSITG